MSPQETIAVYERILAITGGMLAAARENDWDRVGELETSCHAEVQRLMALGDKGPQLNALQRERKIEILHKVLADDAEIRRIAEPWMAHLEQMIGHVHNQRRLVQAYDAGA